MDLVLKCSLFSAIFMILYTYAGYPLLVILIGSLVKRTVRKKDILPNVGFLIAAYNEEKDIEKKIINTLELDYPKDKIEIVVVSDGSTDGTDEIVQNFSSRGVKLYRVEGRVGKTEARNRAVSESRQEIIVFSDATTIYQPDAVKKLVRNFADPKVGLVSGHLTYMDEKRSSMGSATTKYWNYESMIKEAQNRMGTLTGAIGCINAFRRSHYTPLPPNIIEDFTQPLMFVSKGYRVAYEMDAKAFESTTEKVGNEFKMRIRVIRGGIKGLLFAKRILNPFRFPLASFQLLSHKLLRWLVPVFALVVLLASLVLSLKNGELFYRIFLGLQLLFYTSSFIAFTLEKSRKKLRLLKLPLYFCTVNLASLVAIFKTFVSELAPTWETDRNH